MGSLARRTWRELRRAFGNTASIVRLLGGGTGWPGKGTLGIAMLAVLASSALAASAPVVLKHAIDGLAVDATGGSLLVPSILLSVYVACLWLDRVLNEARWLFLGRTEQASVRRLSLECFAHILHLPLPSHLGRKTGALSRSLINGIVGYRIVLQHAIFSVLPAALQILIMATVLGHLYRPVFLAILGASVTAYIVAFTLAAGRTARPMRTVSAAEIASSAAMTDAILNYEAIKYFAAEPQMRARFDVSLARCERAWLGYYRRRTANGLVIAGIFGLTFGIVVLLAGRDVARGVMTIGDFVLVNAYMLQVIAPLEALGLAFRDIVQAMGFLEKLVALMDEKPECPHGRRHPRRNGAGEIVFDRVSFSYGPGCPAVRELSFTVAGGRTVAIVGTSGSGKSTLVRLLVRLLEPARGRILLDGVPIRDIPPARLRQAISVVPQETLLLNDTIAANITLGGTARSRDEIEEAVRRARLHEFVASLPDRLRTRVGERGARLSGGERQRITIARALLRRPCVFVFDEATSALDGRTERALLRNLRQATGGATTILVAHRLSMTVEVDEILVLDRGRLAERGSHGALLKREGRYAGLWRAQMEGGRPSGRKAGRAGGQRSGGMSRRKVSNQ